MNIGIIGSGGVGRTLGAGFAARGNRVMIGSRDPERPELVAWCEELGENGSVGSNGQAARFGELIVVCIRWSGAEHAIELAGIENFSGKVVIDTTNPIGQDDQGNLVLVTGADTSAAETLQEWLPEARIVKAFNWVGVGSMVDPVFEGGPASGFLCGNDPAAKAVVSGILREFGWEPVDMGDLIAARGLEPLVLTWMAYGQTHNRWDHAFKLVHKI